MFIIIVVIPLKIQREKTSFEEDVAFGLIQDLQLINAAQRANQTAWSSVVSSVENCTIFTSGN